MTSHRIKLLITLVLFMVAVAATWTSSQVDARELSGSGTSGYLSVARPGATLASGDPDIGQGVAPPSPSLKQLNQPVVGEGSAKSRPLSEWVRWAGRIWATLYLRVLG